jgi:hypothetical protein
MNPASTRDHKESGLSLILHPFPNCPFVLSRYWPVPEAILKSGGKKSKQSTSKFINGYSEISKCVLKHLVGISLVVTCNVAPLGINAYFLNFTHKGKYSCRVLGKDYKVP